MKTRIYPLLICFLSVTLSLIAGNENDLNTLKEAIGFEKIYVQTDKTYYTQEEVIWYKLFLVDAKSNKASAISDIAYVELHDPKGNVVFKQEIRVIDGTGNGEFVLDGSQPGGLYKLVAYTKWMAYQEENSSFEKELTIQKVITPRLLLKMEFEKRAYGGGDLVEATLDVTDLNNTPADGATIKADIRLKGKLIHTVTAQTIDGSVKIQFNLPHTLDSADGILQVLVSFKGVEESITRSIPIVLERIGLGFYPEGGEMVNGFASRVAFQALNEFGKGADVSGDIVDKQGNKITSFESYHLGMGAFEFTPEAGKEYYARINRPVGNEELYPLPTAQNERYGMKLESKDKEKAVWTIYAPENTKNLCLSVATHGQTHYKNHLNLVKGLNRVEVKTKDFPAGIAVFTLTDEMDRGHCERLLFVNDFKTLQISIKKQEVFAPGGYASFTITTTDDKGKPVPAKLGLSIVDEQLMTFANDKQDHIVSYLLMSSDLQGTIEEPNFYFDKKEPKAEQALDYLLLTHGWRRFNWEDFVNLTTGELKGLPEKVNSLYGTVVDKKNKPVQRAEVFLIEKAGKQRIVKVITNENGQFIYHNVDLSADIHLVTKRPNRLTFDIPHSILVQNKDVLKLMIKESSDEDIPTILGESPVEEQVIAESLRYEMNSMIYDDDDYEWANGNGELDEVVVVGYGTAKRSELTGSVAHVRNSDVYASEMLSYNSALAGVIAGLNITRYANPAEDKLIRNDSQLSLSSPYGFPVVLDGLPVYRPYNEVISFVNPAMVSELSFQKLSRGGSTFGSLGANGVVHINTRKEMLRPGRGLEKINYEELRVPKREFYRPSEFRTSKHNKEGLSSTVLWKGIVDTDENGQALIGFKNNVQTSSFRITVEGLDPQNGLVGYMIDHFITEKPLSVDMKVPVMASLKDTVIIPVLFRNVTSESTPIVVKSFMRPKGIAGNVNWNQTKVDSLLVNPKSTLTHYLQMPEIQKAGEYELAMQVQLSTGDTEEIFRTITYRNIDFPMSYSISGRDNGTSVMVEVPDYVAGTLTGEVAVYTSILNEILDGVESIFQEPYGCFEQVSSSTMPNIFALQLMNAGNIKNQEARTKARLYLESGYKKLAAYEVPGGGFEWYGGTPAHQVLSAYGLVEFIEMSKVYGKVDKKMIERTYNYLMVQRNGKGGFKHHRGKYGFSGVPDVIGDAYIVYAMTEADFGNNIRKEYNATIQEALASKDMYRKALLANAAYTMGDMDNYDKLINEFRIYLEKNNFSDIKPQATIVYTYGEDAARETTAFWLLALLKEQTKADFDLIERCVAYISQGKRHGGYSTTQTTSICLQALARYVEIVGITDGNAVLQLKVNGDPSSGHIPRDGKLTINISHFLRDGENAIEVGFSDKTNTYFYSMDINWYTTTPPSSPVCPLELTAKLATTKLQVNETVRLNVTLRNKEKEGKPMSIAVIGIPGGMSLQPWQLKELQDKGVYDYYEIIDESLVIYYREMGPHEVKHIDLDLKAEIPGTYRGIASYANLYYMTQHKHWIEGLEIQIEEAGSNSKAEN